MQLRKYRWSKDYESAEEELQRLLSGKYPQAERLTAEAGTVFAPHSHPIDMHVWCAEGSLVVTIDNKRWSLQPGDSLDLPRNTMHASQVGMTGCVYYQSPPSALDASISSVHA